MRARRHLTSDPDGTREIWPAFTDVMSTMALILFVLVLLAYVRSLIGNKRLDALQRQISTSEQQLRTVNDSLRRTAAEVASGKAALAASEERLRNQETIIEESNRQLGTLSSQLQSIAVLRVDVLNRLKQAIETELGPRSDAGAELVTIGDNGNIVINESLVFESGSYAIKNEAKTLLDALARAIGHLLADNSVRANIDAIVIQGYTDERGSAAYNWDLSAKRATAVLDYLFEKDRTFESAYGRYFAATGYSKFRPLNADSTPVAYQENRRIEVSVVPKDANVRQIIDDYMHSINPALQPAQPGP
jgi:chemotaxis protein MotB